MKITLSSLSSKINTRFFNRIQEKFSAPAVHSPDKEKAMKHTYQTIGGWMSEPASVIENLLEGATPEQINFLKRMAKKFQVNNYHLPKTEQADPQEVLNIYKMVEKPQPAHLNIIARTDGSFETIEKLFEYAKDTQSLEFVQKLQREVLDGSAEAAKIIIELLKSANKRAFITHPENYSAYLKLNAANNDSVSNLNSLINTGKYSQKVFDNALAVKNMLKNKKINEVLAAEERFLAENYTPEGEQILKHLFNKNALLKKFPHASFTQDLLKIYSSTTPENISIRKSLIDFFKFDTNIKKEIPNIADELSQLDGLFTRIDEDSDVENFVRKAISKDLKVESIKNFNEILNIVPLKKAAIFMNNVKRIVANTTSGEERRVALLKNIENPFFKSEKPKQYHLSGFRHNSEQDGIISRFTKMINNRINLIIYRWIMRNSEPEKITYTNPITGKEISKETLTASIEKTKPVKIEKETYKERKLRLSAEANEYVSSRLSKKHMNDFGDTFSIKATKIRLQMLPEIFASIKDTGKYARQNGLKKSPVSKSDAASLYEIISGNNRKLVRYMLKKRNDNGKRIFTVKDIIQVINDTNQNIKQANLGSRIYNADFVKHYYENIYQSFISEYGNLKRINNIYQ